jgi:hypothetical protein
MASLTRINCVLQYCIKTLFFASGLCSHTLLFAIKPLSEGRFLFKCLWPTLRLLCYLGRRTSKHLTPGA